MALSIEELQMLPVPSSGCPGNSVRPQFAANRWDIITFQENELKNLPQRQVYCQRFNYHPCEMKIHPDEARTNTTGNKQKQAITKAKLYSVEI